MSGWIELISETTRLEPFRLNLLYPDIRDLLPVAIICGISIFLAALWLLVVCEHTWLKSRHLNKSHYGH